MESPRRGVTLNDKIEIKKLGGNKDVEYNWILDINELNITANVQRNTFCK